MKALVVTMGTPEQAETLRRSVGLDIPFICDPKKKLYAAFGLERGTFGKIFNASTFVRGLSAVKKGHRVGARVGDPWQMPGVFVVGPGGLVLWSHVAKHAADDPALELVAKAINSGN